MYIWQGLANTCRLYIGTFIKELISHYRLTIRMKQRPFREAYQSRNSLSYMELEGFFICMVFI
jgi:hypothetical protein